MTWWLGWFCLGWLSKTPSALGGYPAKHRLCVLSNTKRLLTGCLHSFMRGVGFTNVCILYVFFCLFFFGVSYPPIHVKYGLMIWMQTQQHRCAVSCGHVQQINSHLWGKEQVMMLIKSQNKCWKSDYHLALLTMLSALRHSWGVLVWKFSTVSQTTLILPLITWNEQQSSDNWQ